MRICVLMPIVIFKHFGRVSLHLNKIGYTSARQQFNQSV